MIGVGRFGSVFGGAPGHTEQHLTEHIRAVVRAGYSPVLLKPQSKDPVCILSVAQAKKADQAEQQRRLAENPSARVDRVRHACGMAHVIDDPAKVKPIVERVLAQHGGMNVGLHLGRSRLLAVDVDTPTEREAFRSSWHGAREGGVLRLAELPGITVESPGSRRDGEWVHWGGGHWVFDLLPDDQLPAGKVMKGPGGWAAMWGNSYILTPPSSRPEGPYRLVGGTIDRPAWLWDQIQRASELRGALGEGRTVRARDEGGPIDQWSARTSWESLLAPRGWLETSMVEGSCGCPVWTAPGAHSSPKSATAHDLGCARFDVAEGWGPLKIWTDNPPDGLPPEGAVTKLQFLAAMDHDGNDGAAIKAAGIERSPVESAWAVPDEWAATVNDHGLLQPGVGPVLPANVPLSPPSIQLPADEFGTPGGGAPDPSAPQGSSAGPGGTSWDRIDLGPFLDGTYRAPVATMLARTDGLALLYPGLTHSIYGETESAKSWIALVASAQQIAAGEHVLWIDLESDPGALVHRLQLLGCQRGDIAQRFHYVGPWSKPSGPEDLEAWFGRTLNRPYALAVIDAMSGALSLYGLKSTDGDDITNFYRVMPDLIVARTGAGVIVIDHVVKDKETRGRWPSGSERKVSALTGAAFSIRRQDPFGAGRRGSAEIWIAKDRAGGLRGSAGPQDRDGMQQIGEFVLDSTEGVFGALVKPQPAADQEDQPSGDTLQADILDYLVHYAGANTRTIVEAVKGKADLIVLALRSMATAGVIRVETGNRGSHLHYLVTELD